MKAQIGQICKAAWGYIRNIAKITPCLNTPLLRNSFIALYPQNCRDYLSSLLFAGQLTHPPTNITLYSNLLWYTFFLLKTKLYGLSWKITSMKTQPPQPTCGKNKHKKCHLPLIFLACGETNIKISHVKKISTKNKFPLYIFGMRKNKYIFGMRKNKY